MIPVKLDLSKAQISKMRNGHSIQIKHHMIGNGVNVNLSDAHVKKLVKALKTNKGTRLKIPQSELEGCGLFDDARKGIKKVRKAGNEVAKTYDKSQKYLVKNHVGRKVLNTLDKVSDTVGMLEPLANSVGLGPEVMALQAGLQQGTNLARTGINASKKVNSFVRKPTFDKANNLITTAENMAGVNGGKIMKGNKKPKACASCYGTGVETYDDNRAELRPNQSAYNPSKPHTIPNPIQHGGSFRASNGHGFKM